MKKFNTPDKSLVFFLLTLTSITALFVVSSLWLRQQKTSYKSKASRSHFEPANTLPILQFSSIGPYNIPPQIKKGSTIVASDGQRAIFASKDGKLVLAGTWYEGLYALDTKTGTWTKDNLPQNPLYRKDWPMSNVIRDFVDLGSRNILCIGDIFITVRNKSGVHTIVFDNIPSPPKLQFGTFNFIVQTGSLIDGYVYIGGFFKPGLIRAPLDELLKSSPTPNWQAVDGLPNTGAFGFNEARTIESFTTIINGEKKKIIYMGGWLDPYKSKLGLGLYVSEDSGKNFTKHHLYNSILSDGMPARINMIKAIRHNNHNIVFIGTEGSDTRPRKYNKLAPPLYILFDDRLLSEEITNNEALSTVLGHDYITPQRGIDIYRGYVYISAFEGNLARLNLDEIVSNPNNQPLDWKRADSEDINAGLLNSTQLRIVQNTGDIFIGGVDYYPVVEGYKDGTLMEFVQVRKAELPLRINGR